MTRDAMAEDISWSGAPARPPVDPTEDTENAHVVPDPAEGERTVTVPVTSPGVGGPSRAEPEPGRVPA